MASKKKVEDDRKTTNPVPLSRRREIRSTEISKFQVDAAKRAMTLLEAMGSNMENDPRYREAMLGSAYRYPMTSVAEMPMRMLGQAGQVSQMDPERPTLRELLIQKNWRNYGQVYK